MTVSAAAAAAVVDRLWAAGCVAADEEAVELVDGAPDDATLEAWARDTGASPRTVARLFRQELNTSFAQWRQQVVLAKAVALAARKRPMNLIAAELGYASASAFTAMVRRSVGMPPSLFFASAQAQSR